MLRHLIPRASRLSRRAVPLARFSSGDVERESMEYDVVIVGGGPAGLACAIRLKQIAQNSGREFNVCLIEKGAAIGDHILSGAVLEPSALNRLLPEWKSDPDCPIKTAVTTDQMRFLTKTSSLPLPVVPSMHNEGNYVISLGAVTAWLAAKAEEMGVDVFSGMAAADVVKEGETVKGIVLRDAGVDKQGKKKDTYMPGMELRARTTVLAEGCRGSISKQIIEQYKLRAQCDVPKYGLGFKEVWEYPDGNDICKPGLVMHTVGWPLTHDVYGGSYLYHLNENKVMMGMVVGLGYRNPHFNPYLEFQRMKHHPVFRNHINPEMGGKCIAYGARTLSEGGIASLPKMNFPGGVLIGDAAGTLNLPKIKGTHTAMSSGMMAAESIAATDGEDYDTRFRSSETYDELYAVRNYYQAFKKGNLFGGMLYAGMSEYITKGKEPWTLPHGEADHQCLVPLDHKDAKPIKYPKPDGKISFDRLTNLQRSGTNHDHNQPCHLTLKDKDVPEKLNYPVYGGPEAKYCPAGVYEYVDGKLAIGAQNCLHCKACDIKDPSQNINWVVPEGGGGPAYGAAM